MKDNENGLLSKYIALGSRVELEVIDRVLQDDGSYQKKKYESKVVDFIDDDRLVIVMPEERGKVVFLPVNAEYDIRFFTPQGLYQGMIRAVNRINKMDSYYMEIEVISNLQKYQRREYYRYSCLIPLKYRVLTESEKKALESKKKIEFEDLYMNDAQIVNISGGGIRFIGDDFCEPGEIITTDYSLLNGREFKHLAKVLEVYLLNNSSGESRYEFRCQFTDINNEEREEIIKYIFDEERSKRKIEA